MEWFTAIRAARNDVCRMRLRKAVGGGSLDQDENEERKTETERR
jgi:hypothetical protein